MFRQFGYVHRYGIYDNQDLLNISTTSTPAHFRFTSNNALQEISTEKCVARLTASNYQLVLINCAFGAFVDKWVYDSTQEFLEDVTVGQCLSPWGNTMPPFDIKILVGLSTCAAWNEVILEYGGYFTLLKHT